MNNGTRRWPRAMPGKAVLTGVDDMLWPSAELTEFAVRRFEQHGFRHRVEHLSYAGAGHRLAWPNGPTTML
eukprot:808-Eustigmatos_ZCMA.PRE.1